LEVGHGLSMIGPAWPWSPIRPWGQRLQRASEAA